jgi:hypothetical protein
MVGGDGSGGSLDGSFDAKPFFLWRRVARTRKGDASGFGVEGQERGTTIS